MDADAVVVGLGPGGEQVAGDLAEAGLDVVGIEAELVGGECPYWGCIPSKMMVRAADLLAEGRRIPMLAGSSVVEPDWGMVARRIREEATDSWDDTVAVDRFVDKGGRFVRGTARVTGPASVDVGGESITARRALVLATGQRAFVPPVLADVPHWTNREAVAAESVPASLLVVGGGAVGLEVGQAMSRFGSGVTIVEAGPRLARVEEPEVSDLITEVLRGEGVDVLTEATIERAEPWRDTGAAVHMSDGTVLPRRADACRHGSSQRPRHAGCRCPRARRGGTEHPGRRAHAGGARGLGGGRRHREGRLHPRGGVPGPVVRG